MFFKLYFKIKVGLILSKEAKRKGEKERSIVMLMRMVFFFNANEKSRLFKRLKKNKIILVE
jgi:hypothetical protein